MATSDIRFGVGVVPCRPVTEVADAIRSAEEHGFDSVWVGDSQLLWRDTYAALALAACRTNRIQLVTAVSNPITRHPSVIASSINTIAELAPGRVILGLGSGESAVKPLGIRPARRAELRSSVEVVRNLLTGTDVDFGNRTVRLRDAAEDIPIYLAASGPLTTRLAGEVADGAITLAGSSPEIVARSRDELIRGRSTATARDGDPELAVGSFCMITDNIEHDARLLKPICCYVASNAGGRAYLRGAGINIEEPSLPSSVYPDMVHAEDWDNAIKHAERWVTDEMAVRFARAFCLFGTVDEIVGRILAAIRAGATAFYFRHLMSYSLPDELIRSFGEEVVPRVRAELDRQGHE